MIIIILGLKNNSHPFRKKWGQNFLTDTNLLDKIVKTIDPKTDDHFLEIGPGGGALTERIFPMSPIWLQLK